jgi:hypothetical protein
MVAAVVFDTDKLPAVTVKVSVLLADVDGVVAKAGVEAISPIMATPATTPNFARLLFILIILHNLSGCGQSPSILTVFASCH